MQSPVYLLSINKGQTYYIHLDEISCIVTDKQENSISVDVIFSGCLNPGVSITAEANDINIKKVNALIDAYLVSNED